MPKADPIFAAIEENREAWEAYWKELATVKDEMKMTWHPDWRPLVNTVPTTDAGRRAYLEYIASGVPGIEDQSDMILNIVAKSFGVSPVFAS